MTVLHWIIAIVGMTAVGILVWRALQRQEVREQSGEDNDRP